MTEREVKKRLRDAGWRLEEGTRHSMALSPDGSIKVPIPRHAGDIKIKTLKSIEKATGVSLSSQT